jgi:hypothetical protein
MKIGRWLAVIAIVTICVMVFVQGGIADAASSTTRHADRHGSPAPRHAQAFGTASSMPWQIVDLRFPSTTPTSTL